jgi:hypothetical protein
LIEDRQVDLHRPVGNTHIELDRTVVDPPEPMEEADVGGLDMGDHFGPAQRRRCGGGEANQRFAQSVDPKGGQHGQAVALPLVALSIEWEEAHRSRGHVIKETEDADYVRPPIVVVDI